MPKRCPLGAIHSLPLEVRLQINLKLRDGWQIKDIAEWLFKTRKLEGHWLPKGLRGKDIREHALNVCCHDVARWFRGPFREWMNTESGRDELVRLVERIEQRGAVANGGRRDESDEGLGLMVRSILLETLEKIRNGSEDAGDVARLANAFSRLAFGTRAANTADRKVALLERKMNQAADIVEDKALSAEQQRDRLKEIFGR
jgi:hypothetical protein